MIFALAQHSGIRNCALPVPSLHIRVRLVDDEGVRPGLPARPAGNSRLAMPKPPQRTEASSSTCPGTRTIFFPSGNFGGRAARKPVLYLVSPFSRIRERRASWPAPAARYGRDVPARRRGCLPVRWAGRDRSRCPFCPPPGSRASSIPDPSPTERMKPSSMRASVTPASSHSFCSDASTPAMTMRRFPRRSAHAERTLARFSSRDAVPLLPPVDRERLLHKVDSTSESPHRHGSGGCAHSAFAVRPAGSIASWMSQRPPRIGLT